MYELLVPQADDADFDLIDDDAYFDEYYLYGDEDDYDLDDEAIDVIEAELTDGLRYVLPHAYEGASSQALEEVLDDLLGLMPPAEGFNFAKALRQIGNAGRRVVRDPVARQVAGTVLPTAGAAIGTVVGGPIGTAIGGKLGHTAAGAFTGGQKATPAGTPTPKAQAGGSAAAAKLLQLSQNPDVLKALMALALGAQGRNELPIANGKSTAPLGAIPNLIMTLAGQAAADAEQMEGVTHGYLMDEEGNYLADPALPEDRARALYDVLMSADAERIAEMEAIS